ncbi:hypothetical protein MYCTH_2300715 [Thermothelomyces thermophilus ATCC 42464]|uniref:Uncharacterized protein n=1 Tax=Thermothelomyces thermophilus (strain ATCC 42464 / BCRC 31852 / DSM 1799) TaxID=573729 RepID=G2Q7Y7_THET4|nr:uncharacterized protein MYCTH_2300715 [Thermothelomyces thermophilus ATCC 42464]AEO56144.1 hypothetical protein MYCTH_2300715 [Thermothelomyces thermophilus ATCC 42464]
MADNTNPTSSWFRPFGRSNTSNTNQQQQQEQRQSPPLQTRQTSHHVLTHISTSTESPTNESPPRGHGHHSHHHQNQHHQHHHRKSAGATLRTVSSFLNLKSSTSKSGGGTGKSHVWQLSRSGNGAATVATLEDDPRIRTPASLSMLPLTEVDYGSPSSCVDGWYGTEVGTRSRSGSGRSGGRESRDAEGGGERTWHNPNVMQMTEMLSSVMTRMAPGDRLDPTYHSCIFSLIEGFYKLTRRLQDVEEQLAEIKDLRERELDQFRGMTEEWMETSEAYKAEVKRLELALAKESKDGVASVALARHGSLVDRVGSKRFHARLERLNGLHDQDTTGEEHAPHAGTQPVGLAEETTSYRTLSTYEYVQTVVLETKWTRGSIPRILDSQNDVTLSRILEQRELEERMAHQRRGEGRVRAAPVLIHPRGAPEPRDFLGDTLRAGRQPPVAVVERDPLAAKAQENPTADSTVRPGPESHSSSSIGNESSSSSSSTPSSDSQTDAREEFAHSSISSGKSNDLPRKRRQKQSICSESSYQAYHGNGEFPRAGEGTGESSGQQGQQGQQSLLGPPLREKGRRRRYSFEIGDDELLSIAPRSGSEVRHHPRVPSAGEETCVEGNQSLGITPDSGVAQVSAAKPSSNWSSGSISHSTSADTVRWVGEDGSPESSNTRQGQTKAKP